LIEARRKPLELNPRGLCQKSQHDYFEAPLGQLAAIIFTFFTLKVLWPDEAPAPEAPAAAEELELGLLEELEPAASEPVIWT